MSKVTNTDRSSILSYAWMRARLAAAAAGEGVRLHIGAAMRTAWAEAKAALASVMVATPVQQQQACAAPAKTWSIVEDYHSDAVIDHRVIDGMPVLIHHGGRYPKLVDSDGRTTNDAMHVSVWVGGTHTSSTGARVPGSKIPVHVHAHDGFNITRQVYDVVSLDQDDAIAQAMARIGEATVAARTLRAEKAAWEAAVAPVRALPGTLSRADYEARCAEYGVTPMSDATARYRQADVWWSRHSAAVAIEEFLVAKRGFAIRMEDDQRHRDAAVASVATAKALVEELRQQPVSRTFKMVVVGPTPDEHLRRNELWTVVSRGRDVVIDDDAPSIYGEHLLGHEGRTGREVTIEVRALR